MRLKFGGMWAMALILCAGGGTVRADQVQMVNGDRYVGKVLNVSTNFLVLQNAVLGIITVPREKVAAVTFGPVNPPAGAATTNTSPPAVAQTNAPSADTAALASQLNSSPGLIQKIESQFLAGAGPEAKQKFDELLGGVMSGKVTMDDLRAQAKSAADQLRAARNELGDDAGFAVDGYLAILDHFLKNSASGSTPSKAAKPAAGTSNQDE